MSMSEEEINALNDNLKQLNETMILMVETMGSVTNQSRLVGNEFKKTHDAMKDHTESSEDLTDSSFKAKGAIDNLTASTNENNKRQVALNRLLQESARGLDDLVGAVLSNTTGFSKYSRTVDTAGDAVFAFTKSFGPLAALGGLLVKAFSMLVSANLEMRDGVVKATDEMFKMGGAGAYSSRELRNLARNSEVFYDNLDALVKPIRNMGSSILSLGGSAGDAQKTFIGLSEDFHESGILMQFRKLGLTQDDLLEEMGEYIALQSAAGIQLNSRFKTEDQLKKASLEYVVNLRELAALTGKNVEQIQEEQKAALNREQLQVRLFRMQMEGQEMVERGKDTKDEALQAEGERMLKEVTATTNLIAETASKSPGLVDGLVEYLAAGGVVAGKESARMALLGLPLDEISRQMYEGNAEFGGELANIYRSSMQDLLLSSRGEVLTLSPEYRELMLRGPKELAFIIATMGIDFQEAGEEFNRKMREAMEAAGIDTDYLDDAAKLAQAERAARQGRDELVATMDGVLTTAFNALTRVVNSVSSGLRRLLNFLPGAGEHRREERREQEEERREEVREGRFETARLQIREQNENLASEDRLTPEQEEEQVNLLVKEMIEKELNDLKNTKISYTPAVTASRQAEINQLQADLDLLLPTATSVVAATTAGDTTTNDQRNEEVIIANIDKLETQAGARSYTPAVTARFQEEINQLQEELRQYRELQPDTQTPATRSMAQVPTPELEPENTPVSPQSTPSPVIQTAQNNAENKTVEGLDRMTRDLSIRLDRVIALLDDSNDTQNRLYRATI